MARHTNMPPRKQLTPHGEVKLSSRWMRDRYYIVASGAVNAVKWMFPDKSGKIENHGSVYRVVFAPAPKPVTVERELRKVCAHWQDHWNEKYYDWQEGVENSGPESPTITTLGELFDYLYQVRAKTVAASTTSRDRYRLKLWREELGGDCYLENITAECIRQALDRLKKTLSPSTLNPSLGVLKIYLNWAVEMGHTSNQAYRQVKPLRVCNQNRSRKDWWTAEEVECALEQAAKDRHQPTAMLLVACGCYLGLRPGEIVMLRWQDLDLDCKNAKPVCHIVPHDGWKPKDGEARDIPICDKLMTILMKHKKDAGYLLKREPGKMGRPRNGTGWIYRYDPKKVWARIMSRIESAGGRRITMYGMRHSFASNLLIAGVSDVKVSRWLGHSDTRMLHRHYGHLLSYDDDINAIG